MSHGELLALLKEAERGVPASPCRLFPAAFSPDTSLTAYPVPLSWLWTSAASALKEWGAQGLMMRAPLWWQLESPLRAACDDAGAFIFINDPGNMPLGAAAVRQANVDAVVTDEEDAVRFAGYLAEQGIPLPAMLIIAPLRRPTPSLPALRAARVRRELHLFPGVPVFTQCAHLEQTGGFQAHLAEGFSLTPSVEGPRLSGRPNDLLPIKEYEIPFAAEEAGPCACGKTAYRM